MSQNKTKQNKTKAQKTTQIITTQQKKKVLSVFPNLPTPNIEYMYIQTLRLASISFIHSLIAPPHKNTSTVLPPSSSSSSSSYTPAYQPTPKQPDYTLSVSSSPSSSTTSSPHQPRTHYSSARSTSRYPYPAAPPFGRCLAARGGI